MSGFQFKRFFVAHDRCAMKVSTDSIILGSWTQAGSVRRILDIGCGSGLLALMLAQKTGDEAIIDGIEIDRPALAQARDNVTASPWAGQVRLYESALQSWQPTYAYDRIIANPPYFVAGQAFERQRQQARHQGSLTLAELLAGVARLLALQGTFWLITPAKQMTAVEQAAQARRLHCQQRLTIQTVPHKPVTLMASCWGWQRRPCHQQHLLIRNRHQDYTCEYRRLCQSYYLKF